MACSLLVLKHSRGMCDQSAGIERSWTSKLQYHRQQAKQSPGRVYTRRAVELAKYRYTDQCIGCQRAKLGHKAADHSEECPARIVRPDEDLNQIVHVESARGAPTEN